MKGLIDEIIDHKTEDEEQLSSAVRSSHNFTVLEGFRRDVEGVVEVL